MRCIFPTQRQPMWPYRASTVKMFDYDLASASLTGLQPIWFSLCFGLTLCRARCSPARPSIWRGLVAARKAARKDAARVGAWPVILRRLLTTPTYSPEPERNWAASSRKEPRLSSGAISVFEVELATNPGKACDDLSANSNAIEKHNPGSGDAQQWLKVSRLISCRSLMLPLPGVCLPLLIQRARRSLHHCRSRFGVTAEQKMDRGKRSSAVPSHYLKQPDGEWRRHASMQTARLFRVRGFEEGII